MNRVLIVIAAAIALYFGYGWARRAFLSDEDLIRAQLHKMADGVDDGTPGRILSGFDRERYRDETSRFDTEDLRTGLLYVFLQQRLDLDATFDPTDGIAIELDSDVEPPRAVVRFHCLIEELQEGGRRSPWWDVRGTGVMEKRDGDWRFVRSSDIDHSTRRRL
jgi:hypothetical protein